MQRDDAQNLQEFISRLSLKEIRCVAVNGHVINESGITPTRAAFSINALIDFQIDEDSFRCKYDARVLLTVETDPVAEVSTQYVLVHTLQTGSTISKDVIELYIRHNGVFIAYPYIRETIQSTVARIGMGNLVLDILPRYEPDQTDM